MNIMRKQLLTIIWCVALLCTFSNAQASPNMPPVFIHGVIQSMTICQTSGPVAIDTMLAVYDADGGEPETWMVAAAPAHGAVALSYTTLSTGDTMYTSAATYTPTVGYSGTDSFVVSIYDGYDTAFTTIYVNITPPPVAGISGPAHVCVSATISLTAAGSGSWSATNSNATISGNMVTGAAAGRDTLIYIVSNSCGADTAMYSITVDSLLTVAGTISGPDHVCPGASITLTPSIAGGTWLHNTTLGTLSAAGVLTPATGAVGTDTIIYTLSNNCNSVTVEKYVHVLALPDAGTVSGYDSVCAGLTIVLTASVPGGTWTSSIPEFADVDASGAVTGALHGTTVIRYTVTNACGSATATHPVDVNIPAQPIDGSTTLCQGQIGTYIDNVPGGNWSSSAFTTAIPVIFIPGNFLGGLTGPATIIYTVNNACGTTEADLDIEVINCNASGVGGITAAPVSMTVVPNPSTGNFIITLPASFNGTGILVITDVLGREVHRMNVATNTPTDVRIDVAAGIYNITAIVNNIRYNTRMAIDK